MKDKIDVPFRGFLQLTAILLAAGGLFPAGVLHSAPSMDRELILAMEEIKAEIRENEGGVGLATDAGISIEIGEGEAVVVPPPPSVPPAPSEGILPEPAPETEDSPAPAAAAETVSAPEGPAVPEPPPGEEEVPEVSLPPSIIPSPPPAVPEPADLSVKEQLQKRGTLKFVNEDIRVVLRGLAKAYGFNVTLAPEVQGRVTVDFTDVKIIDALETILVDQSLGYRITGDIIRVTTLEKIQQETAADAVREAAAAEKAVAEAEKRAAEEAAEPLEVEIFKLKFIDANDAKEAIAPMLTPNRGKTMVLQTKQYRGFEFEATEAIGATEEGGVADFVRSRTLIVQDTQTVLARVRSVIEFIDSKPPQILIDAKVLEVPIEQESRLGINWSKALNQWEVGASDLQAILARNYYQEQSTTDSSSREWGKEYERLGTEESGRESRLYDGVELTDGDTSGNMRYSGSGYPTSGGNDISIPNLFDFTIPENESGGPFQQNSAWRAAVENNVRTAGWAGEYYSSIKDAETRRAFDDYLNGISDQLEKLTTSGQTYSAVLGATDFSLMLSALKTDSDIVVLSNPRIIVHENYAAKIFVGERYPILKTEVSGESGGTVGGTSVEEWREIGITLKVIPQVRALAQGGKGINMIIHPAVSKRTGSFAEYRSPTGDLAFSSYPIINIREADTNVTINDGDTIVIGGLIESYNEDGESKIPLLGDIPVLGYLFKEEYKKLEKRNLLIFITAWVVTEDFQISAYEKLMLEKSPPESLQDIRYITDDRVRPNLYRNPEELAPQEEESLPREEDRPAADSEEEAGNQGNFQGRVITKAMKRSQR